MLGFTRLLLGEIYHFIELPFDLLIGDAMLACLLDKQILRFCYSDLTWETGGFELASTITLVLQAKRINLNQTEIVNVSALGRSTSFEQMLVQ